MDDDKDLAASSAATETAQTDDKQVAAASSAATAGDKQTEGHSSALEAAKAALKADAAPAPDAKQEDAKASASDDAAKAKDDPAKAATEADPLKTSPDSDVPKQFNEHPAWKRIIGERNAAAEQVKAYEPKAQQYDEIQSYMQSNGLTPDEVAQGYEIMALIKQDPRKALERLTGIMEPLQRFAGQILPPELQQKVDDGMVDLETAQQLARHQSEAGFWQQKNQQTAQQQAHQAAIAQANARVASTTAWEAQKRSSDPDYAKKAASIEAQAKSLVYDAGRNGQPIRTPQEATAILEKAYQMVTDQLKQFMPARPAVASSISSGSSTTARPVPKNALESAQLALEKYRSENSR